MMFKWMQQKIYLKTSALQHPERPSEARGIYIDGFEYNKAEEIPHSIHRYSHDQFFVHIILVSMVTFI
jgi:hypothetical protein